MTQVNSYIYRVLYSLYFIVMYIFYCILFPLIHPGKILIRSAIVVVYFFPVGGVVLNPLYDIVRIIVSTTRPPDIHTDTTRPIRIIPYTRFFVLVIHFILCLGLYFIKYFNFLYSLINSINVMCADNNINYSLH